MPNCALILAPHGRDAKIAQAMLYEAGIASEIIRSLNELVANLGNDVLFVVLTEEATKGEDTASLFRWQTEQAEWSSLPFILFTNRGGIERNPMAAHYFQLFGNVTFVERPFHPTTLIALAKSAVRNRQKQYEARSRLEDLHQSEERFRAAINAVQGVLWTNSATGQMEGEQPAWAEMTGQTFDEYQGYGWSHAVHPEDSQPTLEAWQLSLARKNLFAFEHRVRTRKGQWRNFNIRAIPTFTTEGELREWVGVHTDVTDQRASEAALRELNETLEKRVADALAEQKVLADIFETTDTFVQVADTNFRWLAINNAASNELFQIYGRHPQVGQSILDFVGDWPEQRSAVQTIWQRALSGEEFTITNTFGDPTLVQRTYEIKFNTLRDAAGNRIGAFQFATDVTKKIEDETQLAIVQEALRQSQKMDAIGQLTGGVAHDFNNLLTVMVSGTSMLKRPTLSAERRDFIIGEIGNAAHKAARLTQQLLAVARKQPLRPEIFDVGEQVSALGGMLRSMLGSRIKVDISSEEGLSVNADLSQFETALVNLSVNARDAMHGEGRLVIHAFRELNEVHIAVKDEGDGIDPKILSQLFEPFFTTKPVGKGTDLGLSQVYGFSRQSQGNVQVKSELGVGTCFTLCLPATKAEISTNEELDRATELRPAQRILVVEDNDDLRNFANTLLTEMGHTVNTASSGDEALAAITVAPDKFDVLFTDIVMAGMSGLELARQVRATWPFVKIILTSGYSEGLANAEGSEFPLVSKPY